MQISRTPLIVALALSQFLPLANAQLPEPQVLRTWIEEMKTSERGPFARIRWFCNDGTILPPKAYACRPHGGGLQHGEWTERVQDLRAGGYSVANIFADMDVEEFTQGTEYKDALNQMLIEQFLINLDDGWILRKARYYRGALQEEDERAGKRRLLFKLAEDPDWLEQGYVVLRTAARLLAHGTDTKSATEVRQLSAAFAKNDEGFKQLRNKIHNKPEKSDADLVRAYAENVDDPETRSEYERLATLIEEVYSPASTIAVLNELAKNAAGFDDLQHLVSEGAERLASASTAGERFSVTADLMAALRDLVTRADTPELRIMILDTSLALDTEHFSAATELRDPFEQATRAQRIEWLKQSANAIYGSGLISKRQLDALQQSFAELAQNQVTLKLYKTNLDYAALVPAWGTQALRLHFQESMDHLATIEPLAELFIQDQLRGSPLFFYAQWIDTGLRDANHLAGVKNELFGQDVGAGLRSLNPGLAKGVLALGEGKEADDFHADGIYLLPETTAELPPVAGILTAGEGNPLSHVQLLARNLGIPNVGVDESLIPQLRAKEGQSVILAVSPLGSVRLTEDTGQDAGMLEDKGAQKEVLIKPDLDKLDVTTLELIPLSKLRADDSGRTVGPKAAKLGELYHHFPEAVANGLTIPFGAFRNLLGQPYKDSDQTMFDWVVSQYRTLEEMPPGSPERSASTESFREELHRWIEDSDPGDEFRERLRVAMADTFGEDGTYGVFVRSDTNVEDLPGFTGAGLNLTVANVVGFNDVAAAISRVWASPFTARAFAWRQAHMDQPEHVYPAVLLLRSVPAEKSGVLVTQDIDTGQSGWLSVAVNEGVGGAVDGQAAESLRINTETGDVKLMAQATAPLRRIVSPSGGVEKIPVSGSDSVLKPDEIDALITLAEELPQRFPAIVDANGVAAPADIEFGFLEGRLMLFQIRPFLESASARSSAYLKELDSGMRDLEGVSVDMAEIPKQASS